MKAKRQRDKARDEAKRQQEAIDNGTATDWQQAMKEWENWEKQQTETTNTPPDSPTT